VFRFQCGESGNVEDNPSAVLRPEKVGYCNDLDANAARAPQFGDAPSIFPASAALIRRNCLECAAILSDWLINDMVAVGAYI
jgi:hypothetical protein